MNSSASGIGQPGAGARLPSEPHTYRIKRSRDRVYILLKYVKLKYSKYQAIFDMKIIPSPNKNKRLVGSNLRIVPLKKIPA